MCLFAVVVVVVVVVVAVVAVVVVVAVVAVVSPWVFCVLSSFFRLRQVLVLQSLWVLHSFCY